MWAPDKLFEQKATYLARKLTCVIVSLTLDTLLLY